MYALASRQKAEVEGWLNPSPPEAPPGVEAIAETYAEMKVLFVALGQAMASDKFADRLYFDMRALAADIPPDLLEEETGSRGWANASSEAVHDLHHSLSNWTADKTDVRRVVASADGQQVRAVVWHPQGCEVKKLRWTLCQTADGWRVTDWEDLRTGITGRDMALVCADSFNVRKKSCPPGWVQQPAASSPSQPDDVWLAVYDGMAKNAERRYAEAAEVMLPALRRLSFADDAFKEADAAYCALRDELVIAWRETGKAAEAYRELQPKGWVFSRLVRRPPMGRDVLLPADDLEKLLDAQLEIEGDTFDAPYWRAEVHRMRGQYTDAAEHYRRYIDARNPPFESDWANLHRIARGRLIRCLVRGEPKVTADEADGLVAAHLKDSIGRESQVVRAVVWAYTGRAKEVAEWLRQQANSVWDRNQLPSLYADPDLGTVLKGDPAFAVFRKDFPPPDDKPTPHR